jgi:hypothetical protein
VSKLLSAVETLDLLRRLRDAVRTFTTREEQLQREQQTQEMRLKQRCEAVFAQRTEQLQGEVMALENSLAEAAHTRTPSANVSRAPRSARTNVNSSCNASCLPRNASAKPASKPQAQSTRSSWRCSSWNRSH